MITWSSHATNQFWGTNHTRRWQASLCAVQVTGILKIFEFGFASTPIWHAKTTERCPSLSPVWAARLLKMLDFRVFLCLWRTKPAEPLHPSFSPFILLFGSLESSIISPKKRLASAEFHVYIMFQTFLMWGLAINWDIIGTRRKVYKNWTYMRLNHFVEGISPMYYSFMYYSKKCPQWVMRNQSRHYSLLTEHI